MSRVPTGGALRENSGTFSSKPEFTVRKGDSSISVHVFFRWVLSVYLKPSYVASREVKRWSSKHDIAVVGAAFPEVYNWTGLSSWRSDSLI